MARKAVWAAVLIALAWYSARAAGSPGSGAKDPDFKALQADVDRAWETLHAENAAKYYVKGAQNVFFDAAPRKYENWAAYQEGAQKLFLDPARTLKFTPPERGLLILGLRLRVCPFAGTQERNRRLPL